MAAALASIDIQGSYSPSIISEFGVGPSETDVAKTVEESKYLKVAAADKSFISDAGLRCELALDSKTTSPVLTSTSETDGLFKEGAAASFLKTLAAACGSKAEALGDANTLAEIMAALNANSFFTIFTYNRAVAIIIFSKVSPIRESETLFLSSLFLIFK